MNNKVLKTLEFDKQISLLESYASTEAGQRLCSRIRPLSKKSEIIKYLKQTGDALSRIFKYGEISFAGACDVTLFQKRLEAESSLNIPELLQTASLLEVVKRAKAYGISDERGNDISDSLSAYFSNLDTADTVKKEISRCILSESEICDDASPELSSIRHAMSKANDKIKSELNSMLTSPSTRDCLQDALITTRMGRFCLPVRAEFKNRIPGMVHDQSASGATFFIEPMSIVRLNNELKELELKEKEEIARILKRLSTLVWEHFPEIKNDYDILIRLDMIFAKAMLAKDQNASMPIIKDSGSILLRGAIHPALDSSTAVPLDLTLGETFSSLIITGPNTGGKTVALKTVGLLSLMALSGLFIPAKDRCEIPMFTEIYADIGDEQSIEQSLSTFSSHMTNIVNILKGLSHSDTTQAALVLFDELCSGTDPSEGAALAISILEKVKAAGALCMATTHYSELKLYALSAADVENASCEFNVETLSPTYHLLVGVPGKSNAFAISKKLGLPADVLEDASGRLNEQDKSFDDLFVDLENRRILMDRQQAEIEQQKKEIASLKQSYTEKNRHAEERREKILRDANEKASNILLDAKNNADAAIRNIHKYGAADADMSKLEAERQKLGKKLKTTQGKSVAPTKASPHKVLKAADLHIGDMVRIISMNLTGTVHTLPDSRGNLEVQMGIMHSKVKMGDLELIQEENPHAPLSKKQRKEAGVAKGAGAFSKAATISAELMLLGMTVDEAIIALDKYIDDAYLSHLGQVRIVHGKGTGALRSAVQSHLRKNRHVDSFRQGEYGEGDAGVTIVYLKE